MIPLVVTAIDSTQQVVVPMPRNETEQTHGRNWRKIGHMVGAVLFNSVNLAGNNQLDRLVPTHSFPTGLASGRLVFLRLLWIFDDAGIGFNGVFSVPQLLGVIVPEHLAHVGKLRPQGAVGIPRGGYAPLAAPGFDVRNIGIDLRIIRFLKLPTNKPVLDEDLPAAGHGAVHAVTGTYAVIIAPALPVKILPRTRVFANVKPFAAICHDTPVALSLISGVCEIISRPLSCFPP